MEGTREILGEALDWAKEGDELDEETLEKDLAQ